MARITKKHMKKTLGLTASMLLLSSSAMALSLEEALVSAYETNPRIKAERKNLETFDEGVNQAISGWKPTIEAQYSDGKQRNRVNSTPRDTVDTKSKILSISQPLFRGGRTYYGTQSAKDLVKAGRFNLLNVQQEVLLDAVVAYMDVLRDGSVAELSSNNQNVLSQQLQASRDRFEVGEVTRTDVAQSEARLAQAESDTIEAEGAYDSSKASFERVIGLPAKSLTKPTRFPEIPVTLDEAIEAGLKTSPRILSAHYSHESAEDDVNVAMGNLLPNVSLDGRISRSEGEGFDGSTDFDTDSLLVNMTIPLYRAGTSYSSIREAKSRAAQRRFNVRNTQDETKEQVTQVWENLQTSISTIRAQQASIKAAEIALEGVKQEQLYGARTVLDVLDAEQELFVSRVNLVRAERNKAVFTYNLLALLGQLTAKNLALDTKIYDPKEHYDDVKYQFIGF